jgi:hypothetical protein
MPAFEQFGKRSKARPAQYRPLTSIFNLQPLIRPHIQTSAKRQHNDARVGSDGYDVEDWLRAEKESMPGA